jgi:hypothetical protein
MNRLNPKHPSPGLVTTTTSRSDASNLHYPGSVSAGRLIVLVPADSDYGASTQRIWELAVATGRCVQLLSLCTDVAEEPSLRRQLILMSALVGDNRVFTEAKVEIGANWVDVVKRNYQTDDIILCFAEQRRGLFRKPIHQILGANLDAPVYVLSGLYTRKYLSSNWISHVLAWTGSIGIILGFFLLQAQLMLLPNDWIQTTLFILTVIFDFWLILLWNNLFR